ncbi:MAG: integrase core domain protein [Actinomycetota bacterium]|nr:integrase core domain protein [Actinomycetota bacterium]
MERQVAIVRDHVLAGRNFDSTAELDGVFTTWLPIRRAQVHRTHGQVIAVRAEADRAALLPLPEQPYLVADKRLRRVGKDCLISFESSFYSVPAARVRRGQRVVVHVHNDSAGGTVVIHAQTTDGGGWLATHPRAALKDSWVVDPTHWHGLPDGHTRATTVDPPTAPGPTPARQAASSDPGPLAALLAVHHGADVAVAKRPLADYDAAGGRS